MSSTAFARGSRCSCFSSANRIVLQFRGPKLSPLLLLGFWSLFYLICNTLSRLVCLDARLFKPPEPAASIGEAALLPVSGDSDAPLGSWAATQLTTVPLDRYPAASLQQLQQGEVFTYKEYGNKKVDERRAKEQGRENGGQQKRWLPELTPGSLQQLGIFHDGNGHSRKHNQQQRLQRKKSSWQRGESLLQQQLPQQAVKRRLLSLKHQKTPPQRQNTYFQRLLVSSAGEQVDPTSGTAAYIQSAETAAAQQEQQHRQKQRREMLIQRRTELPEKYHSESFLASLSRSDGAERQVVSRESRADIRPVLVSDEQEDEVAAESKQRRKSSLLDTQDRHNGEVDHAKISPFAPRYHSTFMGAKRGKGHVAAQDNPPAFGKGGRGEILLETRGKSKGIGTILAGAGLSTLLGGLNQYQQGPLAAGPAGTSVPALGGVPVAPAAAAPGVTPAGVATAPAAAAAATIPGAVPAAHINPLVTPAMAPPAESSGHNVLPITVGIILGLVLMCLIGGCIFKRMKKRRR